LTYVVSSPSLFDVLGVKPAFGRAFTADDDRPNAAPVIVVSDALWRQDLLADPHVIGREILLDGQAVTVIGVMPRGFFFPTPELSAWRPLQIYRAVPTWEVGMLALLGRSRQGTASLGVNAEMRGIASALGKPFKYPTAFDMSKISSAEPVRTYLLGDLRLSII